MAAGIGLNPNDFENLSSERVTTTEPGILIVYVDNQTMGKDVWFDNVQVLHYNTQVLEENHYYPFGLTLSTTAMGMTEQPLKYNGKELEKSFDLEQYDFHARMYDPQIGRWKSLDPLAEQMRRYSPYNYAFNNPIRFIDPDGRRPDLYIEAPTRTQSLITSKGLIISARAIDATAQLNSGTSLNITRDLTTGKISATGTAVTPADKRLEQAINDPRIKITMKVNDSRDFIGGSFKGNQVKNDPLRTVNAIQWIQPEFNRTIDKYYEKPGASMLHETVEAYEGGVTSMETGISALSSDKNDEFYKAAHKAADDIGAKEPGTVYEDRRDANGKPIENPEIAPTNVILFLDDGKKAPLIIRQTEPK